MVSDFRHAVRSSVENGRDGKESHDEKANSWRGYRHMWMAKRVYLRSYYASPFCASPFRGRQTQLYAAPKIAARGGDCTEMNDEILRNSCSEVRGLEGLGIWDASSMEEGTNPVTFNLGSKEKGSIEAPSL